MKYRQREQQGRDHQCRNNAAVKKLADRQPGNPTQPDQGKPSQGNVDVGHLLSGFKELQMTSQNSRRSCRKPEADEPRGIEDQKPKSNFALSPFCELRQGQSQREKYQRHQSYMKKGGIRFEICS